MTAPSPPPGPRIRPATAADAVAIEGFTQETFSWGDYVTDQFFDWLQDDTGLVLVGVDDHDTAVAVGRVVLLSSTEAWLHGARVHPDHRRMGHGRAIDREGCRWASERGARVARLMVEDWNTAARAQVDAIGYHPVASWLWCTMGTPQNIRRDVPHDPRPDMLPETRGRRRVPGEERLTPARLTEADLAWMAWSSSELARAARELFPLGWHFRRLRPDDLLAGARRRALWQAPSGWIMQETDDTGAMHVSWVSTSDLDAARLIGAIVELADGSRAERITVMIPNIEWLVREVVSAGFEPHPSTIYARNLNEAR